MGFRFAAVAVAAAILIAALAAFLALHRPATSYAPASPGQDVRAYQALVAQDYGKTVASASNHCNTIQDTACKIAYDKVRGNLVIWLNDMDGFKAPLQFVQIDLLLRHHLAQAMVEGDAGIVAQQAGNATLFDTAFTAHFNERGVIDSIAAAVANTVVVTASAYSADVHNQISQFASCTPCAQYPGPSAINCSGPQIYNCVDDVVAVDTQIYTFEAAVVQGAAPSSLAAADSRIQADLVNADSALLAMIKAGLSGDLPGFTAARSSLQRAVSALDIDGSAV
jgi:hypothetical protein